MKYSLLDLVNEVKLDASSRHPIDNPCLSCFFIVEVRVGLIGSIFVHVDDAVVSKAALECSLDNSRVPRPTDVHFTARREHADVDLAHLVINVQWTHPVVHLLALDSTSRRVGEWQVQTVEVPVFAAVVAFDNGALPTR